MLKKTIQIVAAVSLLLPAAAMAAERDWSKVADALGKAGTETSNGVYRVVPLRSDLHLILDGVELKPTLALGSWLAFEHTGGDVMVMGDLMLPKPEIEPVMKKLAEGGIEITALHNHLLRAQPANFGMHVLGHGDPTKLAPALQDGLALSKTPLSNATAPTSPQPLDLDTGMIYRVLGAMGRANGGVYQMSLRRAEPVKDSGMDAPEAMGFSAAALLTVGYTHAWAHSLHRLSGVQIRARFPGKVLTDGTHWRETYAAGGKLLVEEMGQSATTGSWRIDGDRLCELRPGILNERYGVWGAGERVELRFEVPSPGGFSPSCKGQVIAQHSL